jgi:tetrapyrrole methylase family protein / MazG family protein
MPFSLEDVTSALARLGTGPFEQLQLVDGDTLAGQRYPHFDPNAPVLVLGVGATRASQLRDVLLQVYGPEHLVRTLEPVQLSIPLSQLGELGPQAVFVPPLARPASYAALQEVVARLRAPDGCPWDRALTWEKLRPSLLEETYELLAALDAALGARDFQKVSEEQGDLLLQVALQAQIATEEGRFRFPEVIAHVVEKLIRRHPHVFGEVEVSGTDDVLANWETIKAAERAQSGQKKSPLSGIPPGLPALAQAEAYLDRMSRLRSSAPPAEPWARLAALGPDKEASAEEVGQALFDLVAWIRARGVEAESALRAANHRYAEAISREQAG